MTRETLVIQGDGKIVTIEQYKANHLQRLIEEAKHQTPKTPQILFCGDCRKFRGNECWRVQLTGKAERCNDGHLYWLHNHRDIADGCEDYEEADDPEWRLAHEQASLNEKRKFGGKIIWLT